MTGHPHITCSQGTPFGKRLLRNSPVVWYKSISASDSSCIQQGCSLRIYVKPPAPHTHTPLPQAGILYPPTHTPGLSLPSNHMAVKHMPQARQDGIRVKTGCHMLRNCSSYRLCDIPGYPVVNKHSSIPGRLLAVVRGQAHSSCLPQVCTMFKLPSDASCTVGVVGLEQGFKMQSSKSRGKPSF